MPASAPGVTRYLAPTARLPEGWASDVLLEVEPSGSITSLLAHADPAARAGAVVLGGPVIAGMPNLHSHAFQRAMAGLTETAGPQADSFWAWRELMYRFLEQLNPDQVEVIAAQLYAEMLERGYTSIAEFHYLHQDPSGAPYANRAEMALRHSNAAHTSGMRLTLLPTLYAYSNFGGQPALAGQRRFLHTAESFAELVADLQGALANDPLQRLGLAAHSLRAVSPVQLQAVIALANTLGPQTPLHIHAAEQRKELDDCIAWSGVTPVRWLLEHVELSSRWCLVHCTHMDAGETRELAASGAVAGLCPSTEGDLGDGLFNGVEYFGAGGSFGIGGDSHACVDPFVELRLFEYSQRLRHERRNLLARAPGESLGARLYESACQGGAHALGQAVGTLAIGACADLVVLNGDDPALVERGADALLDSAIFGPARMPVRDVMVGGVWQVRDGRHCQRDVLAMRYRAVMKELLQ
jgi:formimidoylglutamate deiminase